MTVISQAHCTVLHFLGEADRTSCLLVCDDCIQEQVPRLKEHSQEQFKQSECIHPAPKTE